MGLRTEILTSGSGRHCSVGRFIETLWFAHHVDNDDEVWTLDWVSAFGTNFRSLVEKRDVPLPVRR